MSESSSRSSTVGQTPIIEKLNAAGDFAISTDAPMHRARTVRAARAQPASNRVNLRNLTPAQRTLLLLTLATLRAKPDYISRMPAGTQRSQHGGLKHYD